MKYLSLLAFLIIHHVPPMHAGSTGAPKVRHFTFEQPTIKSEGLRYCDIDEQFLQTLTPIKRAFHDILHQQVTDILISKVNVPTIDEKCALKKMLLANDCLLQKNNAQAVVLLTEAAVYINSAKCLLAYCYRYGIGVGEKRTTAKLLLDIACDSEERKTIDETLEGMYKQMHLGL